MERKVLGKGLGALISETQQTDAKEYIERVNIDKIKPSKYQPRTDFNTERLNELIASIKERGVVQPILIRPSGEQYELIAGERRLRAVRSLGYTQIPAVIKDVDDLNAAELSLIENIQREELNPIEEARAYQRLIEDFSFTQEMVGQAVGKDRATISNSLRLLLLPIQIHEFIEKDLLSSGHAKILLSIEDKRQQIELSKKTVKKGLSVRALEKIIKKKKSPAKQTTALDHDVRMIEEMFQEKLGTKVKIVQGKKRSTIHIEYYSNEDLDRIMKTLGCAA